MKATIIIPHLESFEFLKACVRWIGYKKHPDIEQEIIIVDDNSQDGSYKKILKKYADQDIIILQTGREDKGQNAGYPLDYAVPFITGDYVCSFDCDAIPISDRWLLDPIEKLKEGFVFAGRDTGFARPYMGFGKNNPDMVPFHVIDNCYRVSTAKDFRELSGMVGFGMHGNRGNSIECNWEGKEFTPFVGHADSGVTANYYVYAEMKKESYSYPITSYIGKTPTQGSFGQNIAGLVFHMALYSRYVSTSRKNLEIVGEHYEKYLHQINNYGLNDGLVEQMIKDSYNIKC